MIAWILLGVYLAAMIARAFGGIAPARRARGTG